MTRYAESRRDAVLALWNSRKFDTAEIASQLVMREADVERLIHAEREAKRRAA